MFIPICLDVIPSLPSPILFLSPKPPLTPPLHSPLPVKRVPVQDAAVREGRLPGPGLRDHGGLPLRAGQAPSARDLLLQGLRRLVGLLRAAQLSRAPVLPGEGRVLQAR